MAVTMANMATGLAKFFNDRGGYGGEKAKASLFTPVAVHERNGVPARADYYIKEDAKITQRILSVPLTADGDFPDAPAPEPVAAQEPMPPIPQEEG